MNKLTMSLLCGLSPLLAANVQANENIQIIEYLTDSLWVCNQAEECADIPKSELPDPTKTPLQVIKYDKKAQMLATMLNGEEKWFDQTEVQLNQKALASVTCTTQSISKKSDQKTYASFGLGEGCN